MRSAANRDFDPEPAAPVLHWPDCDRAGRSSTGPRPVSPAWLGTSTEDRGAFEKARQIALCNRAGLLAFGRAASGYERAEFLYRPVLTAVLPFDPKRMGNVGMERGRSKIIDRRPRSRQSCQQTDPAAGQVRRAGRHDPTGVLPSTTQNFWPCFRRPWQATRDFIFHGPGPPSLIV